MLTHRHASLCIEFIIHLRFCQAVCILEGKEICTHTGRTGERRAVMILRELLAENGITTITEFARRAQMSRAQAWGLWHGHAQLGMKLARQIAQRLDIPASRFIELEPTPPTPNRGKGGRRSASRPSAEAKQPAPPET
jgi:transcriptional regulator with XRE-family HTH domain